MSFSFKHKLPVPKEIKEQYPVPKQCKKIKAQRDQELADIMTGKSNRFILIVGPCSAERKQPVIDYVKRLKEVQKHVKDTIMIVPRIYTNKPRTTGKGYKGMLHQPDPLQEPDLLAGLIAIRQLHIQVMEETGFTCADEMLYPENHWYLNDVLSYNAVGARSVENQEHRLVASGVDGPCGMKNPTSGDFSVMLNSIEAAQSEQNFIYRGWDVETPGNPLAHAIVRGAINADGQNIANYHYEDLMRLVRMYKERKLENPAIIVDCNHSNSSKKYKEQIRIAKEIMYSRKYNPEIREVVKGLMIESYIEGGCQKPEEGVYGKSITDPCLGWSESKELIFELANLV